MKNDVFAIGVNAFVNASGASIGKADLIKILATGDGPGHLVRALFEDCSLESLDRMAMAAGLPRGQIRSAYLFAKTRHGAANADIEIEDPRF